MSYGQKLEHWEMEVTRREFFKHSALAAGGAALGASQLIHSERVEAEPQQKKTKVVVVTCPKVIAEDKPTNLDPLREMLKQGICALAGKSDASEAWKTFIRPTDAVVLDEAGTWLANVPEVILEVMKEIVQASPKSAKLYYYPHQRPAWVRSIRAGLKERGILPEAMEGKAYKSIAFEPFTALVMAPTLKSHPIAGVSGVVKHFATISKEGPEKHHPNAMHTAGSVIVPQFGHLRKLLIVDALRFGEARRGPSYFQKSLIFGVDPVATDTIALDIFMKNCRPHRKIPPRFHIEAADKEFHAGTSDRNKIEVQNITV